MREIIKLQGKITTNDERERLNFLKKFRTNHYDKNNKVIARTLTKEICYKILKYDNLLGMELKTTKEEMDQQTENNLSKLLSNM